MADILLLSEALRAEGADEASAVVRSFCEPLPLPDEVDEFGAYFDRFADAKVLLLGEASHGTSEASASISTGAKTSLSIATSIVSGCAETKRR